MTILKIDAVASNFIDEINAEEIGGPEMTARSVVIPEMVIDTGATTICLPESLVEELGLRALYPVTVASAEGITRGQLYQGLQLTVGNRVGTFECMTLENNTHAILGRVQLIMLGLEVDLQNNRLVFRPMNETETYFSVI